MSVWASVESLREYTYKSDHVAILRRRKEWFEKPNGAIMALWWVPAGHTPTVSEGQERLQHLQEHGPKPYAFTFNDIFPPE